MLRNRAFTALNLNQYSVINKPDRLGRLILDVPEERQYVLRILIRRMFGEFQIPKELEWVKPLIGMAESNQISIGIQQPFVYLTIRNGIVDVHQTETIDKAKKNAERKVFEETNSFVKAKRQEAIKAYKEYLEADTEQDRKAIETIISMSLADFDEDRHIKDAKLLSWIKRMKY